VQTRTSDDPEGGLHVGVWSQPDWGGLDGVGLLGREERIAAIGLALNRQMHRQLMRQRFRQLKQVDRLPLPKFQLNFAQRRGFPARFDLSLVDAELDLALAALEPENLSANARFKHGLETTPQLLVQQGRERSVTRCVEIGLFPMDVVFPFAASEQGHISIVFLLDRLHETAAYPPHPQRQAVLPQLPLLGIVIYRD
jgi:hypothetical protein